MKKVFLALLCISVAVQATDKRNKSGNSVSMVQVEEYVERKILLDEYTSCDQITPDSFSDQGKQYMQRHIGLRHSAIQVGGVATSTGLAKIFNNMRSTNKYVNKLIHDPKVLNSANASFNMLQLDKNFALLKKMSKTFKGYNYQTTMLSDDVERIVTEAAIFNILSKSIPTLKVLEPGLTEFFMGTGPERVQRSVAFLRRNSHLDANKKNKTCIKGYVLVVGFLASQNDMKSKEATQ